MKINIDVISIRTFGPIDGSPGTMRAICPFPFVHEGVVFFAHRFGDGWRVSEMRTGHYIEASVAKTRKAAIAQARAAFDKLGPSLAKRAITLTLKKYGQVNFEMKKTIKK